MATNPMFNTAVSPNKATAPDNSVNNSKRTFTVGRNTFNYSRSHYTTARYADITPFECIHGVEGDVLEIGSKHSIRTHTLKSPLESKVFMKKSYFQVDMKAILPRNWDRFYINPTVGDDVNATDVNTYVDNFFRSFDNQASTIADYLSHSIQTPDEDKALDVAFHYLMIYESIFSSGSLLSLFGFHTNSMTRYDFDKEFDKLVSALSGSFKLTFYYDAGNRDTINFDSSHYRDLFSFIRHNHSWSITNFDADKLHDNIEAFVNFFENFSLLKIDSHQTPLNYDCICAYQIACANFYSRDSLDNVFSAETYRDIQDSLWRSLVNALTAHLDITIRDFEYEYNGRYYLYDALSGKVVKFVINDVLFGRYLQAGVTGYVDWATSGAYGYFMNLFAFCQSLRYGDYFTGAKPRPLAVGDVTAEVNNGSVNAIDMTVALARARFLNDVNRVGRRPEDYIEDITDGQLPPEITEPRFLASVTSRVSGFEVENTAENQGNIVTILKSGDSNKIYSLQVGHPCIIIGLLTFEIERVYSETIDRFFFHRDRFDIFNKYLQRIGDQKIIRSERSGSFDSDGLDGLPFAYTLRHMEYKQRFPIASGGFINYLPGYLFVTDSDENKRSDLEFSTISSEYLRSKNYEMDKFYSYLTNYSLAGYFHFILSFDNICIAHRKMDYTPSIL